VEAAILVPTGESVPPMAEGEGVAVAPTDDAARFMLADQPSARA
jgi:hypothetical protein